MLTSIHKFTCSNCRSVAEKSDASAELDGYGGFKIAGEISLPVGWSIMTLNVRINDGQSSIDANRTLCDGCTKAVQEAIVDRKPSHRTPRDEIS